MTLQELIEKANQEKKRRKAPSQIEHEIQCECVRWFNLQYPYWRGRLFAVPNGGRRDSVTGGKLKAEGVYPGVSDLILLKSNQKYGALLIEMKTKTGQQSASQKAWQSLVCKNEEYQYVVCRSFEEFKKAVEHYLSNL